MIMTVHELKCNKPQGPNTAVLVSPSCGTKQGLGSPSEHDQGSDLQCSDERLQLGAKVASVK